MTTYRKPISLPVALVPSLVTFILTILLVHFQLKAHQLGYGYYWGYACIVALASLISGWTPNRLGGNSSLGYLARQIVHWGVALVIIYAYSFFPNALTNAGIAYPAFVVGVLGFAAVLSAIHLDFKFIFFGIFLVLVSVILQGQSGMQYLIPYLDQYSLGYFDDKPLYLTAVLALVGFVLETIFLIFQRGRVNSRLVDIERAKRSAETA